MFWTCDIIEFVIALKWVIKIPKSGDLLVWTCTVIAYAAFISKRKYNFVFKSTERRNRVANLFSCFAHAMKNVLYSENVLLLLKCTLPIACHDNFIFALESWTVMLCSYAYTILFSKLSGTLAQGSTWIALESRVLPPIWSPHLPFSCHLS